MILLELVTLLLALDGIACLGSVRLRNLHRAFFNLFLGNTEKANIPALIELAKEDLKKTERQFNEALAQHAGQSNLLMTTVTEQRARHDQLEKSVQFYLDKKDEVNAGKFAAQLEALEHDLSGNETLLTNAESTYKTLLATRDSAIAKAQATLADLGRRAQSTELRNKTVELQENAEALRTSFSDSGNTLSRISSMVQEQESRSIGRARVVADSVVAQNGDIPTEVTESSALEKFKAKRGLGEPKQLNAIPIDPIPTLSRSMGPVEAAN